MSASTTTRVVGDGGLVAELVGTGQGSDGRHALLRLADGREVAVAADLLTRRDDGSLYLPLSLEQLTVGTDSQADHSDAADAERRRLVAPVAHVGERFAVPIVEERVTVGARKVERGKVRIIKTVREEQQSVEQPLLREEVDVERVPREEFVDGMAEPRHEGETLVIPIYEEVIVVEKRLMLREEVRVTRRRTERTEAVPVTVRREEVRVERVEAEAVAGG